VDDHPVGRAPSHDCKPPSAKVAIVAGALLLLTRRVKSERA
jgi:hypothetical protein